MRLISTVIVAELMPTVDRLTVHVRVVLSANHDPVVPVEIEPDVTVALASMLAADGGIAQYSINVGVPAS